MGLFDDVELGIPSLSLKGVRKGQEVRGFVLPIPKKNPKTGAIDLVAFREDPDRDQNGNPRLFPSGDPIMVGQVLLKTPLRDWDMTSAEFQMRTEDFPEETDEGLRRWFIGSKYATKAVKAAMKSLRKPPEVGGTFALRVVGIEKGTAGNGEPYTYPNLQVTWGPATDEGRAAVEAYVPTMKMPDPESGSSVFVGDDPWAEPAGAAASSGGSKSADDDAPPF